MLYWGALPQQLYVQGGALRLFAECPTDLVEDRLLWIFGAK